MIVHIMENKLHKRELELCARFNKLTLEEKEDIIAYCNSNDSDWAGDWDEEQTKGYQEWLDTYYEDRLNKEPDFCFICSKCKTSITDKTDFYFTETGKILCGKCIPKRRKLK